MIHCVIIGTEQWLASKALGLTINKPFAAWKGTYKCICVSILQYYCGSVLSIIVVYTASNGQVGGYRTVYNEMTYATVRGAGHMVSVL